MNKVAIYHRPIPFIEGNPLQELRAHAESQGWEVVEYIEGKSKGQPVLGTLLKDAKQQKFDTVLTHSLLSIGGCSLKSLLRTMDKVRGLGIGLVSLQENITFDSTAGAMADALNAYIKGERSIKIRIGQELARARNVLIGKKPMDAEKVKSILQWHEQKKSIRTISRLTGGTPKSSVFDVLKRNREAQTTVA